MELDRRSFVKSAFAVGAVLAADGEASARPRTGPVLDAHIHLFDPGRQQGVPWPKPGDSIYKPSLPDRYEALAAPMGIVGAIAIEASPWPSDNDWLLDVVAKHPVMVGMVGDLLPEDVAFQHELERLHADPFFLGIRYGNLWDRDLGTAVQKPAFVEGLKALARAGLVFETANPDAALIHAVTTVAEKVPELTIVIDHLPHAVVPTEKEALATYVKELRALGARPRTFAKVSEVPVLVDGKLVTDAAFYRRSLDAIWASFGEDRLLFGSDWPNSDHVADLASTVAIVKGYMAEKSSTVQHKFYFKNSRTAYRWKPRTHGQQQG